jgi:glyoxylase-like metal-dependent hydrolase (beta-lactamase superfamily II)
MDIKVLDINFFNPNVIEAHLIETSAGPILIETGPDSVFKNLEEKINESGYQMSDIKHVFVTHIHLDHSGAAWHFSKHGAKIYVHERGAPHIISPEKLMKSAAMIYGDDMDRLWGNVENVPEDLVYVIKDQETINIGNVKVKAIETPGHASHHHAYQLDDVLISGDVTGNRINKGPILPPTPPPDINIEVWQESINKIRELNPSVIYPTHFGGVGGITKINEHLDELQSTLLEWTDWIGERVKAGKSDEEIIPEFEEYCTNLLNSAGVTKEDFKSYELSDPFFMNVGGLTRYWRKFRLS